MPNWPEDPRRRNVYDDVYGQSLPMPGQTKPQGIPSLADLATLVNQPPQPSRLPSPNFQQQQPAAPSLSQLQPPLMPQSQQAVAATDQSPKKPFFSLPDVANALYEGATQQFIPGVKGTVAQLYSGLDRPDLQPAWVQRYQAEGRAAQEMAQRRNEEQAATGKLSSAGEAVRQAIPSLPFSLGSMAAALPAGIAGTVATGPVGGAVAAGAAAGAAGYRMAASQFMDSAFASLEQESQKKRGRPLSEQEKAAAYTELKPVAEHTGLWEAGPEAISNAAMFGLGRVALGFMPKEAMQNLAKTALGRVGIRAGAAAGAAGTEVATETATQVAQGNDQAKADAAIKAFVEGKPMGPAIAGAERPYDGLAGLQKAYNDVVGATLATVVMMGGLAKGAHLAYKPIANRIEAGRRGQEADTAVNQTDPIRTNLEFARESDIAEALSRFDEIEAAGRLPKSAARRIDAARQQLLGELSLRVSPESISAPMNSQRGMAGYLGLSERVNELDDAQLADLAGRALPENAEPTLTDAAKRYQAEIGRRQSLTDSAAHFEQNPDAVAGVAKTLDDIATGKPMSKGAHGSTAFNLASLSDDMLRRYQLAGEVLLRDHSEALGKQSANVERSLSLLNEESQRRADGQTRDPEAIREADLAERAAAEIAKGKKPNIKGLSFETLDRMASGLEARASLEPRLADSARMLREAAQQGRLRAFNPQGQQQPGIQSAMRGWNAGQTEDPAKPIDFTQDRARLSELAQQADVTSRQRTILDQEARRRATREQQRVARSQEIAALNQQNPPLATPQGLPTVTPAAIPQSLGRLGQTRLGNGVDQLPIPAQPQPSTPNVTESQGQGRQETSPMGLPSGPTRASQGQARGTPEQAASALLRQVPGRLGEQARLNQEWVRPKTPTGENAIPAVASTDTPQGSAKKPLVLWGYKPGTADEPIKIAAFTKGEQQRREKAGWKTAAYEQGTEPVGLREQARLDQSKASTASGGQTGGELVPEATTQPQPEQRREERQAEAAPLLSQEAEKRGNAKKPKAKGVAPTWNDANEIERAAMISRSSEKSGAPVSNAFVQRKAAEWKTWADIPDGPAKQRLRDYMADISRAENTPNRTESQGKESDIKPSKKAAKQSPPPASKGASRNRAINATVDAGKDSLLTAIAKIGGLDRAEAQRQGIDLAEFKRMPVFGKPVFRKNGGKSFDAMAESLSEFGYPVLDEKGNYSPNVLLDAISRELAGNPVYTPQGIESAAQRDAEEQAKFEQDNWLLDAIDLENAGFDALNDQEQVTAQLQAEASRDLGEDAADTIFERISQQHEQAAPEQFNEALGAAFNEARQRQSANSREQAGEPGSVQATDAILQDYSIEELRAEEERIAKAQSDQEAKDKAAQQKTAADRARSDFVLTGSNRPADVAMARGQTNLLGAMEGRPKTRQSKPSAAPTNTIQQARAQLIAALNDRSVAALERSGKLILHRTDPTRTGAAGYVDPQGVIHLIPSNMDQDALSVALHEAMHLARDDRFSEGDRARIRFAHAALKITGLKNFIGNPGFSNLVQQLHRLAAEGNKTAIEALDKARREAPGNVEDEALAYLVQYADENLPLVRRIIAAIRAALYRMGIKVKLTPADVRALALSALKARAKDAALVQPARTQESFSLPEFAPTESDKAEVERQMKAIKEIRDGQGRLLAPNGKPSNLNERQWKQVRTKFFNDWFGDWENDPQNSSKVVDANGEPLVVYHGSPDARFISEDATFKSQKERYGFGGELGVHWFASSENTAKTYADVRRAFDYQSADPGVISAFLNIRDPIKIDAFGKKWRDAQKIGKTSDVIDQAHREERDGVIIDNVKDNYQTGVVKGDRPTTTFSVFRSAQIKSAIGNAGTFSARSNRIDYSQPTTETDAAEQDRLWQEFQAVRAQFQAKQVSQSAFDRWFGKGVEGVNARNGKPLVLYRGTNNPEFNQWDESRSGQASQHPTDGLGFFMTADKRSAARYGSRLLELHAKIDNPYFMTDADLVSIEDTQDAARFRRKLQAQGYDAAVISAPGGAPYVVALRSNQVKLASNDNPTENEDFRYSMSRVANRFGLTDHEVVDAINSSVDQLTSRDELIRNNVTDVPAKFNRYKIGSAQIETFGGDIKNRYINFLREFDPNDLILSESEEGIKKHPTYQQYVKWAKDGIEPPYIFVAQTESGKLQATNRRRTLAAREAGRKIKGWYGPFNQETGNPLKYGDILDAVAENRYSRPGRRQPLDSPRLASKVLDDIGGVRSTLKPGERALAKANPSNFKKMLSDLSADTRPAWLGFLTRNMQLELAKEVLPSGPVAQFEKSAEQLDADESKMIQTEGFPVADRWQDMMRKDRAQADAVGRALYMSTWLGVDPRTKAKNGKQAEWVRAKAAYDALNPAAKQLYGDVLDFYQKQTDRMFMELDARIDRHSIPAPDKKAMRDQLRREFERVKQDGPYAPLMRFGDLTVFAEPRKAGDKPVFATFESVAEQRAFFDYLKREGYAPQLGVKMEEVVKRNLPQGDFVDDLAAAIDRTMSGPEAQIIKDSMYQLFLRSLPEQAIRKHFMHRKFVPGYSADALRTFATFARRSAKQVARLKHGDLMSDALNQMMKAVKSGTLQEPVAAGHLVNELDKTFQWAMAPTTAQWASKLTSLGFMWHLGASPAHLFLNLSQQAQVTAPWLAGELHGKMGFGSVASALLKANKDFIASNPFVDPAKRSATANKRRQALEAEFGGDLGRALTALEEAGKTDKTQTYSLAGLSEEDSFLWSKPYLRKAIQGASWFFHTAEVVNREASAIAAYRLGRRSGLNHDQAYDLARRAINESHFDYSPSNRARYMRSNVAKVLTLFKQYSLNISWQLGRNAYLSARGQSPEVRAKARTKLLGMLGMTSVMAGAAGMPFYGEVMWMLTQLMNATRDDDEPEKDADLEFRRLLDSAFSPTSSEAVRKGLINAFLGVDFSSRIKLDDLWWRSDNRDLSGRDAAYAAMEQALGPVAGLAVRGYSTIDELLAAMVYGENARGDSWRAMETSMPKMLKDISRSIRYMKEGATTYQGARILDPGELSTGAAVGQALGFAPAALADQYEINSAKMKIQTHILRQRRALLDTYAMARAQNDDEVKKAAIEDMRAFNKRYPTIAITRQTLLRSMTSRDRRKAEIEKSGGVALDRRLVDVL